MVSSNHYPQWPSSVISPNAANHHLVSSSCLTSVLRSQSECPSWFSGLCLISHKGTTSPRFLHGLWRHHLPHTSFHPSKHASEKLDPSIWLYITLFQCQCTPGQQTQITLPHHFLNSAHQVNENWDGTNHLLYASDVPVLQIYTLPTPTHQP